jgi:tryptophan synthase alpha chain
VKRSLARDGGVSVVPYLMCGHPNASVTVATARRLARLGVAAIELGIPFSDPLADGPVIQRAGQVALDGGMSMSRALSTAAEIGGESPLVLMSYVNPILAYGPPRFAADAARAGVAGVIVPDLPPEEAEGIVDALRGHDLWTVFLVAPTSSDARIRRIAEASTGFVYCVTVTGITGERAELPAGLAGLLARVRAATELPVAAGFGISRPEQVASLRGVADLAVVGSAIVRAVDAGRDPVPLVESLVAACR